MTTSSFLAALRLNASLPLVFRAGAQTVAPGYHLTEVKRVTYETMDCGSLTHRWAESQFEIWVPTGAPARGHMPAEKFLQIVDRVERELPLRTDAVARLHASLAGQPAALYAIEAVTPRDGALWVELSPDRTRCKAAERRAAVGTNACCGGEAPVSETASVAASAEVGCCGSVRSTAGAVACCA